MNEKNFIIIIKYASVEVNLRREVFIDQYTNIRCLNFKLIQFNRVTPYYLVKAVNDLGYAVLA